MRRITPAALLLIAAAPLAAQQPTRLTADDYARAERMLGANTAPLVSGLTGAPTWLGDGRFWYRVTVPGGAQFVTVDPARGTRAAAFDHTRLATALQAATGGTVNAAALPFRSFEYGKDGRAIVVAVRGRRWACSLEQYTCAPADSAAANASPAAPEHSVSSPDGRYAAFVRDHNLWVRDLASGRDRALTTDGVEDFGYATNNAGWIHSDEPVLLWSPDSKRIYTFQHDARGVSEMYLVTTNVGAPRLERWRYPFPGDSVIFRIHRVVVDVENGRVVRFQMPPDEHRSTVVDHVAEGSTPVDVQWYPDGSHVAFVSVSRDHKQAALRVADAATGAVRTVLEESSPTQFQSGWAAVGHGNWRVLPASNEVLWWSQRDDWGHLYLYDLRTGALEHQVTRGAWNVVDLMHVDERGRALYFTGVGHEAGRDPYYAHFYRIGMDGQGLSLLTPENAYHAISVAPDGRHFVDAYSTLSTPPVTVLRRMDGAEAMTLEHGDASRLLAAGWHPPTRITVKARDGRTDLYGFMFTPTRMDSTRRYPIVNYVYPGPWNSSAGAPVFAPARGDHQALAELGFIVVAIDATGTELRSKSFHDAYYGRMGDNGLADQVAGMRELAGRYRWIDLDRAGIWGHSGGGFATADAMFRYPDFFKVGISESGNHDNRNYEDDWGERFQGLLQRQGDADSYAPQANQLLAQNLRGHLLLAHGGMDDNVPPQNTYLVVDALIKANKDFDLVILPQQHHGYGTDSNYMMRRRWDYFVRYLMGAEPPHEYQIGRR